MVKACVIVYGDIGRSPRMQNHAMELSVTHDVYFMGYLETPPRSDVALNPRIHLISLQLISLVRMKAFSYWLYAFLRVMLEIIHGVYLLAWRHRDTALVLMQNPPCIPGFLVVWIASILARFRFVVDFHNYGYSILALNIQNKLLIRLAQKYEQILGGRVHRALCVSECMRKDLKNNWGIEAVTLYDRPLTFQGRSLNGNALLHKYGLGPKNSQELLLVSSTSWTKDENFSVLLDALQLYEKGEGKMFIRTLITGKGPEKQWYLEEIARRQPGWQKISVTTVWLEADDYPLLLQVCDLGVCLHFSSSGLDLPMKVVDMFAAGLPVLARNYTALGELLRDGANGYTFESSAQLARQLLQLTSSPRLLTDLAKEVEKERRRSWHEEWTKCSSAIKD